VTWLVRTCITLSLVFICILFVNLKRFSIFLSLFIFLFQDFVGISSANPHDTSLVYSGKAGGLKGLLYMLNATLIFTKVS